MPKDPDRVVTETLKAIVVIKYPDPIFKKGYPENKTGIIFSSEIPPNPKPLQLELETFLDQPLLVKDAYTIAEKIWRHYQKNDHPMVYAMVPQHKVVHNVLQIQLVESTIGAIHLKGNKHFEDELIQDMLSHKAGEVISENKLHRDLYWLNSNPSRLVHMSVKKGTVRATSDLHVEVEEHFPYPYSYIVGMENSGNLLPGYNRYTLGFNHYNLWGLDHLLNISQVVGDDLSDFHSHTVSYRIPLHRYKHVLQFYGTRSATQSSLNSQGVEIINEGQSYAAGVRYEIPFSIKNHNFHKIDFGLDLKQVDSSYSFSFSGIEIPGDSNQETVVTNLSTGYHFQKHTPKTVSSIQSRMVYNPGNLMTNADDAAYENSRAGAESSYAYATINTSFLWHFMSQWALQARANAQYSPDPLISSEQIYSGGDSFGRGFDQNSINGDFGYKVSIDLLFPHLKYLFDLSHQNKDNFLFKTTFQPYLFSDWAYGGLWDPGTLDKNQEIWSVGLGIKAQINNHTNLNLNYAWQLLDPNFTSPVVRKKNSRLHLSIQSQF